MTFHKSLPHRLPELLEQVKGQLNRDQIDLIEEFIYVGEFRLALESLVGYLAENGARPSEGALQEIDALTAIMGMSARFQEERSRL